MLEVNTMSPGKRRSCPVLFAALPALVALGCIDEADTFKSRPDPVDAGREARSSTSVSAPSSSSATVDTHTSSPPSDTSIAATGDEQSARNDISSTATNSADRSQTEAATSREDAGPPLGVPAGEVAPELVGVWQQTGASLPSYEDEFGETFDTVSEFSVQLKISAEGQYHFAHLTSGSAGECGSVTRFDMSTGTATLDGNVLTLQPAMRNVDLSDCDSNYSDDTNLEPIVFTVRLAQGREAHSGMRTFVMSAEGYAFPLSLALLFRPPTYVPEQPLQPKEFVRGVNGASADLRGRWVADAAGTDQGFYDPTTDAFHFPEVDDTPQRWLRLDGNQYEAAVALQDVGNEGVCKLDLIYYEQGTAAFEVLDDVDDLGLHFVGHVAFDAIDSRLLVNVRDCEADDGVVRYDLPPLTSYYRWVYFSPDQPPESFSLACEFEMSEWQSLLCDDGTVGFVRPQVTSSSP